MSIEELIQKVPEGRKEAILQAKSYYIDSLVGPELQWGPSGEVCARIILGEKPKDIAPELTKKEASDWAYQNEYEAPEEWLWASIAAKYPDLRASRTHSIEVMRWCERMMKSPSRSKAMVAKRCIFGEADEDQQGYRQQEASSVAQRLDEIEPQDLTDSPRETLQNAVNRQMREEWDGPDELRRHEPWMDELPSGCHVIRTWPDLFREGQEMRHCVSSYADKVANCTCVIVSIRAGAYRSTAEYRDGKLVQHQSFARSNPHPSCVKVAQEISRMRLIP